VSHGLESFTRLSSAGILASRENHYICTTSYTLLTSSLTLQIYLASQSRHRQLQQTPFSLQIICLQKYNNPIRAKSAFQQDTHLVLLVLVYKAQSQHLKQPHQICKRVLSLLRWRRRGGLRLPHRRTHTHPRSRCARRRNPQPSMLHRAHAHCRSAHT
jgi:hypothetical protein